MEIDFDDLDADGIDNKQDTDDDGDGMPDVEDADDDNDGVNDTEDFAEERYDSELEKSYGVEQSELDAEEKEYSPDMDEQTNEED